MSKGVTDVPEWFHGCQLNYAENLLQYADTLGEKTAVITAGELIDCYTAAAVLSQCLSLCVR